MRASWVVVVSYHSRATPDLVLQFIHGPFLVKEAALTTMQRWNRAFRSPHYHLAGHAEVHPMFGKTAKARDMVASEVAVREKQMQQKVDERRRGGAIHSGYPPA